MLREILQDFTEKEIWFKKTFDFWNTDAFQKAMQSFFLKNTINIQVSAQFQGLMNSSKPTEFQINDTGGCKTF